MIIYSEPDAGKEPVLEFIRSTEKELHINSYLIDDPDIMTAISNVVSRKIGVRIIIDGHPYDGSGRESLEALRRTGAQVNIAPERFEGNDVFDHAKYMVNEKEFMIGTMNLTDAAFKKNREYFVRGDERKIHKSLMNIFNSDWEGQRAGQHDRKFLIVSPDSENRLYDLLRISKKLFIETEEIGNDDTLLEILSSKGRKLKMILPSSISENDQKNAETLQSRDVQIRIMPANIRYMHAKMIHNKKMAFIGSQNFSETSLRKNREVGIIIKRGKDRKVFMEKFEEDWKAATEFKKWKKNNSK
jgi:phosphatidylserine/phosphatidylglycerophosphate/cardiolipin synthase-like enzyme